MSLINQMLRDLENRSEGPVLEQQEVLQGLGSTGRTTKVAERRRSGLPYVLIVLLTLVCGFLVLERMGVFRQSDAQPLAEQSRPAEIHQRSQTVIADPVAQTDSPAVAAVGLPEWRDSGTDLVYELLPESKAVEQATHEISDAVALTEELFAESGAQSAAAGLIERLHEKVNQGAFSVEPTPESGTELAGVLVGDSSDSMHWDALQTAQKSAPTLSRETRQDSISVVNNPDLPPSSRPAVKADEERPVLPQVVDKAEVIFSKTPAQKSDREQALEQYQDALKQIKRRKHNQAIASLQLAIKLDHKLGKARILLATQMLAQGQHTQAEELLVNGLQITPDDAAMAYTYARILVAQDRIAEALSILDQSQPRLEINPDYHAFSAALLQRQEEHQAAISKYSEVLRIRPDKGVWWMGLGISLQAEGLQQRALQAFQTALRDNSLTVSIRQYLSDRISILQGATG